MLSDLVRRPRGRVAARIAEVGEDSICTSIVVAAEFRYGAEKVESARLAERVDLLLATLHVLPIEPPADRHYAQIRHRVTRAGTPIGPNDLLIAAHALAADLRLVTANTREFERVPSLHVDNWLLG
jgi:tRNA(fMet)-specific endonuclease VapC